MAKSPRTPKPMGRPSRFTQTLFDGIMVRVANGESLLQICRADGMPSESTVRGWVIREGATELSAKYARARDLQADHYAEKIVDEAYTTEDAAMGRLRMDALKWAASKLAPKRYGDKIAHVGGEPDDNPINVSLRNWMVEAAGDPE